jgi:Zn-dependent peptidase ImmA (M78 family)
MKEEKYTSEEVYDMFDGRLPDELRTHKLNDDLRISLAQALTKMPKGIVEWARDNLIFVSSTGKPAFCISRKLKPFKGIIFLSDCLRGYSEKKQAFIIAHEIAHFKLNHKCGISDKSTKEEIHKQQNEANELARKWLGYDFEESGKRKEGISHE